MLSKIKEIQNTKVMLDCKMVLVFSTRLRLYGQLAGANQKTNIKLISAHIKSRENHGTRSTNINSELKIKTEGKGVGVILP